MGSGSNAKRKREDREERKPVKEQRRLKQRQEELELEFSSSYHGLTALYKLLEVQHLRSPLFLPRTLSYRLVPPRMAAQKRAEGDAGKVVKSEVSADNTAETITSMMPMWKKKKQAGKTAQTVTGATLHTFKIGMTAETIDVFKRDSKRIGLLFAVYTADGRRFVENSFELVATCLIPVPCAKEMQLPQEFAHADPELYIVTVQVVEISDVIDQLKAQAKYVFSKAASQNEVKPVLGADLLLARVHDSREPLFGNMLRLNVSQRRTGVFNIELPALAPVFRGVVKVQFRVKWDPLSKTKRMNRLESIVQEHWGGSDGIVKATDMSADEPLTDELTIPKRMKPSPWTRRGNTNVWFHYLYHSMLRRMSEKRPDFSCAWCNLYAGSLRGLVSHLVSSHHRFRFHVVAGHDSMPHIYVMPRNTTTTTKVHVAMHPSLCELHLDDDEREMDRIEHHFTFESAKKQGKKDVDPTIDDRMQEFDELEAATTISERAQTDRELNAALMQRQYFHSRTGAVVLDHEKDYDSDDDVDEEWITQQSERLLDEFEDVSLEEKEFMKKWNRHVKANRILADFMVASSCRLFAKRHGKWLLEAGLRYNFLLHLFNLWDNSLLNSRAIIDCMLIVDHHNLLQELRDQESASEKAVEKSTSSSLLSVD